MRVLIQRVKSAYVKVGGKSVGEIDAGLLIFLGVSQDDDVDDADYLVQKLIALRIFEDEAGKMNLSALDAKADLLVVSQFTLYGDCTKGRRPSFDKAAEPKKALDLYQYFVKELETFSLKIQTGEFGAMMDVGLINDGPVTFILESRKDD